jgi:hypothetical protein
VGGLLSGAGEVAGGLAGLAGAGLNAATMLPGAMAMLNPQMMSPAGAAPMDPYAAGGGAPMEAALPSPTDSLQSSLGNILDSVFGALDTATQALESLQQLVSPSAPQGGEVTSPALQKKPTNVVSREDDPARPVGAIIESYPVDLSQLRGPQ